MYIIDQNGGWHVGGTTSFTVAGPTAGQLEFQNVNAGAGSFRVKLNGASSEAGISEVRIAVWSNPNQRNLKWYTATRQSDGSYITDVNIANHGYEYGTYYAHAYVYDNNGISNVATNLVRIEQPTAIVVARDNGNQNTYHIQASNVGYAGGVKDVQIAVWSNANGQDDLIWYSATNNGNGTWSTDVPIKNHRTAGSYNAHMYIIDQNGGWHVGGTTSFIVDDISAKSVSVIEKKESDGTFVVGINGMSSASGISEVKVAVWSTPNQSDLIWYRATDLGGGNYQIGADVRNHQNNTGVYHVHAYATANNGIMRIVGAVDCSMINVSNIMHPIMGSSSVTVDQMVAYYNSVTSYPEFYSSTEAPTIRQFCQIYLEECNAEGVKAEVAFVQAMKETNFLRYGGDVSIGQFNFAGIGATGNGAKGNYFVNVTTGIRAHVQHLKAYASTQPLNRPCVDPRFQYVTRNTAPYCEWLGIKENPYGKGWATAVNYGYNVVERMNQLKMY